MVSALSIVIVLLTSATVVCLRKSFHVSKVCAKRNSRMSASTIEKVAVTGVSGNQKGLPNGGVADIFQDVPVEVTIPQRLTAEGAGIPVWLRGTLLRNGPGLFGTQDSGDDKKVVARRFDHIFDGAAKISRYEFNADGSVDFSAKFLHGEFYKALKSGDVSAFPHCGPVNPPYTTFQKVVALFTTAFDNACVNVHQIGGKGGPWVGVTDAPVMVAFDLDTLETKGLLKMPNKIVSLGGMEIFATGHPHYKDGYTYNLFSELRPVSVPFMTKSNIMHMVRTSPDLRREVVGSVETGGNDILPYIHDFSLTENYAVLAVWPLNVNLGAHFSDRGVMRETVWVGDKGVNSRIYVFDIKGARKAPVASFEGPPLFAYHHVNAYESAKQSPDGSVRTEIVLDVSGYDTPDYVNGEHPFALVSNIKDPELRKKQTRDALWYRFNLPMPGMEATAPPPAPLFVTPSILTAIDKEGKVHSSELVRLDPRRETKRHRFSYGLTSFAGELPQEAYNKWAIVKLDHDAAEEYNLKISIGSKDMAVTCVTWQSPSCFPSEAIFVPNPTGPQDEDSGVLLSQVYDGARRESFLLVLDAQSMAEVGRYYTGITCPVTFHGQFIQK